MLKEGFIQVKTIFYVNLRLNFIQETFLQIKEKIDKSKEIYNKSVMCTKCYLTPFLMNKHEMECKFLFLLKGRNISYFYEFIFIQYFNPLSFMADLGNSS
ncbi:hypothetical protein RFI_07106 [Reticulomyxa filosa]|uniref:Uncharacterized protein n=1 Tax=Reticulomyxa filosa TaxID=46433 RepID=X6NUN7_RETFI|nr:hypothetical protein RFI_07106 [Reticulomyxa filosa]|eukprot:ETO30015.1 hypothetical protein RFI_07106 [Reticulomyxa filosa]